MDYIDGPAGDVQLAPPGPILSRHFTDYVRGSDGLLYGIRMYKIMRYWDEDRPGWDEIEHDFAQPASEAEVDCITVSDIRWS
jgi:hypothetical protein